MLFFQQDLSISCGTLDMSKGHTNISQMHTYVNYQICKMSIMISSTLYFVFSSFYFLYKKILKNSNTYHADLFYGSDVKRIPPTLNERYVVSTHGIWMRLYMFQTDQRLSFLQ